MIYLLFVFLTLILTLVAQSVFSLYLPLFGLVPELVLISVVYFSLKQGAIFGEFYGFVAGIILDVFSLQIFGLRSFLFTIVGFSVGSYSHKLDESKIKVQVLINFVAMFLCFFVMKIISVFFFSNPAIFNVKGLLWTIVYSCAIVPFEFILLEIWVKKIKKWSGKANLV